MEINSQFNDPLSAARIYTDFDGLARLRGQATQTNTEQESKLVNKEVAQQFEALFLQMMLKAMRQASQFDESAESDQTRFYQEMFDKQIALNLSNDSNGIGLMSAFENQLSNAQTNKSSNINYDNKINTVQLIKNSIELVNENTYQH